MFDMKLVFNIDYNLNSLLTQEDTDNDKKITVEDKGPKLFDALTADGNTIEIKGTYFLSNFLQELILAKENSIDNAEIDINNIFMNPVDRLNRMIKDYYWENLTRRIDATGIKKALVDTKSDFEKYYLYVPFSDNVAYEYYKDLVKEIKDITIDVVQLPSEITPEFVFSINNQAGIVTLDLQNNDKGELEGVPFVVPGGRFNEMYGWDSYFESLGLLIDGRVDLAKAMADNFVYEIKHYRQILNANRTYYLTRSQPPFLTSLTKSIFFNLEKTDQNKDWLKTLLNACITEYNTVWLNKDRLTTNKLSRYYGNGMGISPETEFTHYDTLLEPLAKKANIPLREYYQNILERKIIEPEVEEYIKHDRSIRESGHDTSYRLDNICANLNTVDLNSLLYKYEIDIAELIKNEFDDCFVTETGITERSRAWLKKAEDRKTIINKLMWNQEKGFFFDYNFVKEKRTEFESATTFYPLWAKLATKEQADLLVEKALPVLEFAGGVAGSSKNSCGIINDQRPQKQWDYPNGWAPHQMIIWQGLINYGYNNIAERLAYKWLYTILKNAVDYNGTIPEKYDVVLRTHKVFAEYGNVGTEFDYISREGFGWMNASFKVGQTLLNEELLNNLKNLIPPEIILLK